MLGVKMRHLAAWTDARRTNAARYNEALKEIAGVVTPIEMPYAKHVYHLYVIRAPRRDELAKYLRRTGSLPACTIRSRCICRKHSSTWGTSRAISRSPKRPRTRSCRCRCSLN